MNKKQLISIIRTEVLLAKSSPERKGYIAGLEEAINIIEGFLDGPQKVTIPHFVADWIEECKAKEKSLLKSLLYTPEGVNSWVDNSENQEAFAKAWLFGYEVEEEKRYLVIMPNVSSSGGVLTRIKHNDSWIWIDTLGTIVEGRTHTRKELEDAGFGWVFDCEGVEVEEVE